MAIMLVTCPESAHLEEIDIEVDPLGALVTRCSAFSPCEAVDCARTCAARLDRRRRDACAARVGRVIELRSVLRR
jgi:hypothetical protein